MEDVREASPSVTSPSGLSNFLPAKLPPDRATWYTPVDSWGLSRLFFGLPPPTHDPDGPQEQDQTVLPKDCSSQALSGASPSAFFPYPNRSSFELGDWWSKQVSKRSVSGFTELVSILGHPDFNTDELKKANWPAISELLSHGMTTRIDAPLPSCEWVDNTGGDWKVTRIQLPVPFSTGGKKGRIVEFPAGVLHHRSILSVIKERMVNPKEHAYRHICPYKLLWNVPDTPEGIRLYGELYTSDEFLRLEKAVQNLVLPDETDQPLERVIVALMFWTDATLLANFGTTKLWPCYIWQ
jgi:hypothetical protein